MVENPTEPHHERKHTPSFTSRVRPGDVRDGAAADQDAQAVTADLSAIERDDFALRRDDVNIAREIEAGGLDRAAAEARYRALRDRLNASADRLRAANMRNHAQSDRSDAAEDRRNASVDELTGSYRRESGLKEIARDLGAARRRGLTMVLGFLDVDGLKETNDNQGHAAGDAVLQAVSATLRSKLREYDLTVRYGGDEFLFSVVGTSEREARRRIGAVNTALRAAGNNTVTCGLVTIAAIETLATAIDRADHLLYANRTRHRGSRRGKEFPGSAVRLRGCPEA